MQSKMSDTETKTIFISNNRLLQYKTNKAKQKNRQCVSSILALDSYVFFSRLTLKSYTNYMLKVTLHFVSFFCLFVWFLNFDLNLFCTILHLLCFLCLFVGSFFCLWLFVLLFYCVYLIAFCLCVCVCVCACVGGSWITWDHFSWIFDPIINKEILQYINCFGNVDMWC